jgi:hypothetical protein
MAVTYTKLEEFTGSRTSSTPDPENEGETIDSTTTCRDIHVRFTDGSVTHERYVNVCYDSEGNYDEVATNARIEEHCLGVANKIAVGVIS